MTDEIDDLISHLREEFLGDLPANCNMLENLVLTLETGANYSYARLMREVHSMKGAAGSVGLRLVSDICHEFESFLSEAKVPLTAAQTTTALSFIDLVRKTVQQTHLMESTIREELGSLMVSRPKTLPRVLLLELSQITRSLCEAKLKTLPIRLETFENEFIALNRLQSETFALLICSGQLTDMPGADWLRLLRDSDGPNQAVPVLMITNQPPPDAPALGVRVSLPRTPELPDKLTRHVRLQLQLNKGPQTGVHPGGKARKIRTDS